MLSRPLVDRLGYQRASEVAAAAVAENETIRQIVVEQGLMTDEEFDEMVSPERVTRLGSD